MQTKAQSMLRRLGWRAALAPLAVLAVYGLSAQPGTATHSETGQHFQKVVVMMLENQEYKDVIGNTTSAPFINGVLEEEYASATNFYANKRNSPTSYFAIASGRLYSAQDGGNWAGSCMPSATCSTTDVSVFEQLTDRGKTWKVYSEDQTAPCQTENVNKYWVNHNPGVFYSRLGPTPYTATGNGGCMANVVGAEHMRTAFNEGTVPDLTYLFPNNCNNMHDSCHPTYNRVKQGDVWLKDVLTGDKFVTGGLIPWAEREDALIVITFDEGNDSDFQRCCPYAATGGGGKIPTWVIGPASKVKRGGHKSEVYYSLFSIFKAVQENFNLPLLNHANDAATANLDDFYHPPGAGIPNTTIDSGPQFTSDTTPEFAFSSDEPAATFQYQLDGGDWTDATSPLTLPVQSEGQHTLVARAMYDGVFDRTPAERVFRVDVTKPVVSVAWPTTAAVLTGMVAFEANATDNFSVAGAKWYVDGTEVAADYDGVPWRRAFDTTRLIDGPHTIFAKVRDDAMNWTTSAKVNFTIDNTRTPTPANTSITAAPTFTMDPTPDFSFGANEAGAIFECKVGAAPYQPCTSPHTVLELPQGKHTFYARAIDTDHNVDPTPALTYFTVDTQRPTSTLTTPAHLATVSGNVTITQQPADNNGVTGTKFYVNGVEIGLDYGGAPWNKVWDTTKVADGVHRIYGKARDAAGNWGTSNEIRVTVKNAP